MKWAALAPLTAWFLLGCGHVEFHEVILRSPSPGVSQVEVYLEGSPPARPVEEVAILQAIGYGAAAESAPLTAALVARAEQLGCDALVRVRLDEGATMASGTAICARAMKSIPPSVPEPPNPPPPAASPVEPSSPDRDAGDGGGDAAI